MLRLRVLTAAIGLPLVLLALFLGPHPFSIFLAVVAAVCTFELCRMAPALPAHDPLLLIAVLWATLLATRHTLFEGGTAQSLLMTAPLVVSLLLLLSPSGRNRTFGQWAWMVGGALYVGWLFGHWGGLYILPGGRDLVLFGLLATFSYDTFAYLTGRLFGRHKMAPRISTSKTWEGACGGLLATVAVSLLIRVALQSVSAGFPYSVPVTLLAATCVAIAAQLGDLVESALKRSANVKDAGGVLPGHGGMLDRFDSLLFTGTMLYYFSLWMTS